jgi:hypothetical protein
MMTKHLTGKKVFFGVLIFIAAVGVFGTSFLLLWNWLMPVIFGLPQINFYQAIGLFVLSKIIFSGFGHNKRSHKIKPEWREHFEKKYSQRCGNEQTEEKI